MQNQLHRRRSLTALAVAALVCVAAAGTAGPAGAEASAPAPPPEHIVGGTEAAPGAWPSQVALVFHEQPNSRLGLYCGGTVLSATWVLTAGHCMFLEGPSPFPLAPSDLDVLSGTQNLSSGGTRVRAAQFKIAPGFDWFAVRRDLALVRLAKPIRAPKTPIIEQGGTIPTGADLVTTGWGETDDGTTPAKLRQVHVPAVADATCKGAYEDGEVFLDSMFCAGDMVTGGLDSCSGDSGGPISRKVDGTWIQVGIVSWGPYPCGDAAQPGVYTRLSAFGNWIGQQTRLGPHRTAAAAATRIFTDFWGRAPSTAERDEFVRFLADNGAWALATYLVAGHPWQDTAGDLTRLYQAYFGRTGDTAGLMYWLGRLQSGAKLSQVSAAFAASSEFAATYGALDPQQFVDLVYENTLGRSADASGLAYWSGRIARGELSRSALMTMFAQSSEFHRRTDATVNVTLSYLALVRRVATPTELSTWSGRSNGQLNRYLIDSFAYASRF